MTDRHDGGPAYPLQSIGPDFAPGYAGMSLRDWFAGQAHVSDYEFKDVDTAAQVLGIDPPFDDSDAELVRFAARMKAALRFMEADAMIAASEGKTQ